jgi:hypothetical protein
MYFLILPCEACRFAYPGSILGFKRKSIELDSGARFRLHLEVKYSSLVFSISLTAILEYHDALDIVNVGRYKGSFILHFK